MHDFEKHKEVIVEFKNAREVKIREHTVNVHVLDYNAVKADLKGHLNESMTAPELHLVL